MPRMRNDDANDECAASDVESAMMRASGGTFDRGRRGLLLSVAVGLACGVLSGLFGIGGGTIIVPALIWLGLNQRQAAATSLAVIVPTSLAGVVSYAMEGNVDWASAVLLALGVVVGSQIGSLLLSRLPEAMLRWIWVAFLMCVIVQQLTFTPLRDGRIVLHPLSGLSLIVLGVFVGTMSGILGVGGGAIMMPALSLLFGAGDLLARGTSLLVMVPGAISGSITNWKRGLVQLGRVLTIGVCAAITAPLGTWIAGMISPRTGSLLFAAWLAIIAVKGVQSALKATRAQTKSRG